MSQTGDEPESPEKEAKPEMEPGKDIPSPSTGQPDGEGSEDKSPADEPAEVRQSTEADWIKTVFNTTGPTTQHYYEARDDHKTFKDPTEQLPKSFEKRFQFKLSREITEQVEKLIENRLALLVCRNDAVLRSMACTMMHAPALEGHEKRLLSFKGRNAERDDLHMGMFSANKIGGGEKLAVIVEIDEQRGFFDTIFGKSLYIESTRERLREKNILLICIVNSSLLRKVQEEIERGLIFHHWKIDFLPYLLDKSFPGTTGLDTVEEEILKQREYGLWDKDNNDHQFYQLISRYIRKGKETFDNEVKIRRDFMAGGKSSEEFMASINKVKAEELFDQSELHQTVLYAAVFFNELTPVDFFDIVTILLKERTTYIKLESRVITENDKERKIEITEKTKWSEIWKKKADKVLKECHTKAVRADDHTQFIEFTSPYLRSEMKTYVEEEYPMFLRNRIGPLLDSGLVFSSQISSRLRDNLIRLTVEMAIFNPAYFGADWFIYSINSLYRRHHLEVTGEEEEEVMEEFFRTIERIRDEKWQFFGYLSDLIREMLNHSELQGMINGFLKSMIDSKNYNIVLYIVKQLGLRLMFAPHFDIFIWIERLLGHSDREVHDDTRNALLGLVIKSEFKVYELLEKVRIWLPSRESNPDHFTTLNQYSLLFILDYGWFTAERFDIERRGEWPSNYPLFYPLQKDKRLAEDRLSILIEWLLHPGIQDVFDKNYPEEEYNADYNAGRLVAWWTLILLGNDIKTAHPGAVIVFDIMLRLLHEKAKRKQKRRMVRYWGLMRGDLKSDYAKIDAKEKKVKQRIKLIYKVITNLINRFKQYQSTTPGKEEKNEPGS
jgi:hypothetical protein